LRTGAGRPFGNVPVVAAPSIHYPITRVLAKPPVPCDAEREMLVAQSDVAADAHQAGAHDPSRESDPQADECEKHGANLRFGHEHRQRSSRSL
jgi:hypothetical protein